MSESNAQTAPRKLKTRTAEAFKCAECGRKLSLRTAQSIAYGTGRCPGCGGCDVDIN